MRRKPWWADLDIGPVTATIDTGAEPHRVSWREGKLRLHDHDLRAEDVLLALGGEPCPCLLLRDAFRSAVDLPQSTFARITWQARGGVQPGSPFVRPTSAKTGRPTPPRLLGLPLMQRLRAHPSFQRQPASRQRSMIAGLHYQALRGAVSREMLEILEAVGGERHARDVRRHEARPDRLPFEHMLQARVEPALREALRWSRANLRSYASLTVECGRTTSGDVPTIEGYISSLGGFVNVSMRVHWLNRVWRRGLAVVDSYFVLDVDAPAPATNLRGTAVVWERRSGGGSVPVTRPCLVWKQDETWHLAWV